MRALAADARLGEEDSWGGSMTTGAGAGAAAGVGVAWVADAGRDASAAATGIVSVTAAVAATM
ncbi:hypothetical protein BRM26_16785, partial [Xanthomonas oryzae pv. oryzae]